MLMKAWQAWILHFKYRIRKLDFKLSSTLQVVFLIIAIIHVLLLQNSRSPGRCNCHTEVWNPEQKCLALGVIYTHNVIKQEKQEAICIQIYTLQDFFLITKKKIFLSFGKHRRFLSVLTISILDKWHWERGPSHPFLEPLQFAKKIK